MGRVPALVLGADDNYAQGLAVALHSALEHLSIRPSVHVLDNGLSGSSRDRLARIVPEAQWVKIDSDRLASFATANRLGSASYARLLAPELVPADRIVYLDCDLIVRGDLSELFTMELRAPVAAARDFYITSTDHKTSGARREQPRPYFNAGVLVIDVQAWQAAGITNRALAYAAEVLPPFADQDALNATVDEWDTLDPRWNVQHWNLPLSRRQRQTPEWALYRDGAILHFVGPNPWEASCMTRGTIGWVRALVRSGFYSPLELGWLVPWLARRVPAWFADAAARRGSQMRAALGRA
jgi:lipopolysaccharide biosynthesis glycosyltransferase